MKKSILAISLFFLALIISGCEEIFIDVKPQSCPNTVDLNGNDVLPVAILGTDTFDVFDVDVMAVTLLGVEPIDFSYEDVSTPVGMDAENCECTDAGPDGYLDIVLRFDTQEVAGAMEELAEVLEIQIEDGQLMPVILFEGTVPDPEDPDTFDDIDRLGYDCVIIRQKGKD